MIVKCSSCSTRYAVDPTALGASGRRVKCARCGHLWFQTPIEASDQTEGQPPITPPPAPNEQPRPLPPGSNLPAPATRRLRPPAAAGWALLALLLVGLVTIGYVARDQIVRVWPATLKLYDELGVDMANARNAVIGRIGTGLTLIDVTSERVPETEGSGLVVRGRVVNGSTVMRTVPPLKVALSDVDGRTLTSLTFTVEPANLDPGEAAAFETTLGDVDGAATKLAISIAEEDAADENVEGN